MTDTIGTEPLDPRTASFPAALLGGMPADEFFARCWRRRYLHVRGGAAGLLHLMPSVAQAEALLDRPGHLAADVAHAITFPVDGRPVAREWVIGTTEPRRRDPAEPVNLLPAELWYPRLYPLAAALGRAFGAPASLQLFWGPPGGGLAPHRDMNDSFVIQIEGAKRWRGADVTDERPTVSGIGGGTLDGDALVFDLEPGDVLYKPSHAVHTTESGTEPTLALTCSITTRTAGDLLLEALGERLAADPRWLERLPFAPAPGDSGIGTDDDAAVERIVAALAELPAVLPGLLPTLDDLARRATDPT